MSLGLRQTKEQESHPYCTCTRLVVEVKLPDEQDS